MGWEPTWMLTGAPCMTAHPDPYQQTLCAVIASGIGGVCRDELENSTGIFNQSLCKILNDLETQQLIAVSDDHPLRYSKYGGFQRVYIDFTLAKQTKRQKELDL